MGWEVEAKHVGDYVVRVMVDDEPPTWDDILCDEPLVIFARDRWGRMSTWYDNTQNGIHESALDMLRIADDECNNYEEVLDAMDAEWRWTHGGRIRVDHKSLGRTKYYRNARLAARAVLNAEYGGAMTDYRIHCFQTQDVRVYAAWSQAELDKHAGIRGAKAPIETIQAYLDGEVYGYAVEDEHGNVLDSCWGFIGDSDYAMQEGINAAQYLASR